MFSEVCAPSPRSVTAFDNFVGVAEFDYDKLQTPIFDRSDSTSDGTECSVSSLSSAESSTSEYRSIFSTYWEKKGGKPKPTYPSVAVDFQGKVGRQGVDEVNAVATKSNNSRRRIWNSSGVYNRSSEPCLGNIKTTKSIQKSLSAPVFDRNRKPASSCLLKSRYSGSSARRQEPARPDSSVVFSDKVDVAVLAYQSENWAPENWSDWIH